MPEWKFKGRLEIQIAQVGLGCVSLKRKQKFTEGSLGKC
jgi:hypothetical protein